jgi:hypothetical protein
VDFNEFNSGNQPDPNNYIALANNGSSDDDPYSNNKLVYNALIDLGVPDKTAAGAVGSLMGEGGRYLDSGVVNPRDGADGSDSIGFGQWNGPRAQALKATTAQMGLDHTDPQAQVAHLVNELNGPYAHVLAKLQNAPNSIESGANIWTRHYEVPKNPDAEVASRTGYGYQFADALGNGSAPNPNAGTTDYANNSGAQSGGSGDVNTVSTNASNTGAPALAPFLNPMAFSADANPVSNSDAASAISKASPLGAALNKGSNPDSEDDSSDATSAAPTSSDQFDALKQAVFKGVPGIGGGPAAYVTGLLNSFVGGGKSDAPDAKNGDIGKFGNTLVRVGAALMARDNPSGAQALLNAIPKKDKDSEATVKGAQVITNGQGQSFVRNIMSDGTVKVTPLQPGQVSPAELAKSNPQAAQKPDKMSMAEGRIQMDASRAMAQSQNQYDKAQELQDAILSGKFSPTWDNRAGAFVDNTLGHSTQSSRYLKDLNSLVNRSTLTTMSFQKGTATDQRMKFDLESIFPKGSQYDAATVFGSLDRVKEVAQENYGGAAGTLASMSDRHSSVANNLYIGRDKVPNINDYIKNKYETWDKKDADLRDRYDTWIQQHDHPTATAPAPSVGVARPGSAVTGSPVGSANNAAGGAAALSGAEPSLSGGVPAPVAPQNNAAPKLSTGAQSILDDWLKRKAGNQ